MRYLLAIDHAEILLVGSYIADYTPAELALPKKGGASMKPQPFPLRAPRRIRTFPATLLKRVQPCYPERWSTQVRRPLVSFLSNHVSLLYLRNAGSMAYRTTRSATMRLIYSHHFILWAQRLDELAPGESRQVPGLNLTGN
jgi:hypothetical protein